jgi:hypothetical protein
MKNMRVYFGINDRVDCEEIKMDANRISIIAKNNDIYEKEAYAFHDILCVSDRTPIGSLVSTLSIPNEIFEVVDAKNGANVDWMHETYEKYGYEARFRINRMRIQASCVYGEHTLNEGIFTAYLSILWKYSINAYYPVISYDPSILEGIEKSGKSIKFVEGTFGGNVAIDPIYQIVNNVRRCSEFNIHLNSVKTNPPIKDIGRRDFKFTRQLSSAELDEWSITVSDF